MILWILTAKVLLVVGSVLILYLCWRADEDLGSVTDRGKR